MLHTISVRKVGSTRYCHHLERQVALVEQNRASQVDLLFLPVQAPETAGFFVSLHAFLCPLLPNRVELIIVFLLTSMQSVESLAIRVIRHMDPDPANVACTVDRSVRGLQGKGQLETVLTCIEFIHGRYGFIVDERVDICVRTLIPMSELQAAEDQRQKEHDQSAETPWVGRYFV